MLNLLLEEFILYNDDKVELRFKLSVNEKQIAEKICSLAQVVKSSYEEIPYCLRLPAVRQGKPKMARMLPRL
jgi:hypothetical protein